MDFDINAPVDSIDKVPEQFRSLYAEVDGKPVIDSKFTGIKEALTGLNTSLKAARAEAKSKTTVDLSPLAEFGADPASIKAAFEARVADLVAKGGDATKAVEKVRSEMSTANKAALDAEKARTTAYQNQLHTILVENTALAAIAEAKGLPDLLMPFIKNQVKVVEEDGKFVVHVLDGAGERRYSGVTGQPMTIKELVTGMKADTKYGRLFESDQQQGGGGKQPGSGGRQVNNGGNDGNGVPVKSATDKIAGALGKGRYAVGTAR